MGKEENRKEHAAREAALDEYLKGLFGDGLVDEDYYGDTIVAFQSGWDAGRITKERMQEMIKDTIKNCGFEDVEERIDYDKGVIDGMRNLMQKILDN